MSQLTSGQLLADLVADSILQHHGSIGVLVRDIPSPDPKSLLVRLKDVNAAMPIRIAYLRPGGRAAAEEMGLPTEIFSDEVEQAERWRNDRELNAVIVVIAHGDEAKLSSLEDFAPIISKDLKRVLVGRALGGPAGQNEVQSRWWHILADDDAFGLGQLIDYFLALHETDGPEFLTAATAELYRLGLLPDPAFFNVPLEKSMRLRLQANRDLIARLQTLTPRDRRTITQVIQGEVEPDVRRELGSALEQLNRTRWEGEGFKQITLQDAERLVRARTKKTPPDPGVPVVTVNRLGDLGAAGLIDPERRDEVAAAVSALKEELDALDDTSRRLQKVRTSAADGAPEGTSVARLDVLGLMSKLLDEGVYGGLIEIEEGDLEDILRKFDAQHHLVARWERNRFEELLSHLRNVESGTAVANAFNVYDESRAACLPLMRPLAVEPLLVAASPEHRVLLLALVDSYEALLTSVSSNYEDLFATFGADIDEVVGHILLLETVIIRGDGVTYAIAAPTHPLYIWHYAKYCQVVDQQRERLDTLDRKLVADAATRLPNFLTSLFVPATAFGRGASLPHIGRLGPLPYFGELAEANSANDGWRAISTLLEAFLDFEPHARLGLRVALIEPPDPGIYLTAIAHLAQLGEVQGAHLAVLRRPGSRKAVELRLDEEDEDLVARVFRSSTIGRRFTFEVAEIAEPSIAPEQAFHVVVIFDRSGGRANRARPVAHPIQPLAVPRRIHYSAFNRTVELEPAPGGPFNSYDRVVGRLAKGGQASYLSVHQTAQLRQQLTSAANRSPWTIVADRAVDRDLSIGALRVSTARDGERDIAAFARSAATFRRPLREVARNYNTAISDAELDDLLVQLSDLLDSGLVNLRPDLAGRVNHNRIKGLLGTLIAARWFRSSVSGERLLISLDSDDARRWLHLSPDPQRADLLGFEWTGDHCTITVLEVKALDNIGIEFAITNGIATGSAVDQALATRRLLEAVFAGDRDGELITTPARREILREHLYRELTKGSYSPEERQNWSDRLQRLLDGEISVDLRCHIVAVRLGVNTSTLIDRSAAAQDGDRTIPIRMTELNELLIESLRPPVVPPSDEGAPPEAPTETAEETQGQAHEELASEAAPAEPARLGPTEVDVLPAHLASAEPEVQDVGRPRAFLGTAPGTYGRQRDIWFDPGDPGDPLPNPHIMITGETGSGKTQATKAILADLSRFGVPAMILDFKDDYSDSAYADAEGLRVYDPAYEPLPFNPLAPAIDRRTGRVNPVHHMHELSGIVRRIYGLGEQQAYRLREAIKRAYEFVGVEMGAFVPTDEQAYPTFEDVRAQLLDDKAAETVLGRMSPIFDLGLFATGSDTDFASMMAVGTVVRLGQLPGDETKNSVAEFFLMGLYNYLIRQPQTHQLGRLLVLDEAWRLIQSPFLTPLMREGRAFGLGVLIATQFPRDLPETVSGSTATKVFFSQTQLEQIREVQRTVAGKTSGPEADHVAAIEKGLSPLTCILHSKQFTPFVRVTIRPYFARQAPVSDERPNADG